MWYYVAVGAVGIVAALIFSLALARAASEPVNHGQSGDIDPAATPPPTPTGLPQSLAGGVQVRHSREASLSSLPASSYANGPSALRMPGEVRTGREEES